VASLRLRDAQVGLEKPRANSRTGTYFDSIAETTSDESDENEHELLSSAYDSVVALTGGVDLAAQVERW
jgi:hypothetical protein